MIERLMLVNAVEKDETRIALVADRRLEDYHIERTGRETLVGNIYKGRIENVHASLQAAFVNIGFEKNAFLHVSEVFFSGDRRPRPGERRPRRAPRLIQNLIQPGQDITVQVIRDEFGEKGPSVSMELGIPGRFLVLTPLSKTVGISKKIVDRRQRTMLQNVIRELRQESDVGFILRTASGDVSAEDIHADHDYLMRLWRTVLARVKERPAPAMLYQETELVLRAVRDFFQKDIQAVVVDDPRVYQRLRDFFHGVMPQFQNRLRFHDSTMPITHHYGIEQQIEQLNQKAVPLPSGGTIVIQPTEALTAIDVNSGRLVREANPEELAFKTNMEVTREVMRQIRLRDIGGILVIDFIDMKQERHRRTVEQALRQEADKDRAQMVILPMSPFCLLEIARQKIRPNVQLISHDPCPACGGTGIVKNIETMGLEVLRALKSTLDRDDVAVIETRVSPDVASFLRGKEDIAQIEIKYNKRIHINTSRDLPNNHAEFTCYNLQGEKVVDVIT